MKEEDEFFKGGRASELVLKQLDRRQVYVLEELIARNPKRAKAIKEAAAELYDAGLISAFQATMRPLKERKRILFTIIMRPGVISISAEFKAAVQRAAVR